MNDSFHNNQIKSKNQLQTKKKPYSKKSQSLSQQEQNLHFNSYIKQLNDTFNANHNFSSQPESISTIKSESEEDYNHYFKNHPFVVISQHSSQQYPTPQLLSEGEEEIFTE